MLPLVRLPNSRLLFFMNTSEKLSTKEKIIHAAFSFYCPHREAKFSLSKVAEKVGITKPAIYRHFSTKDELVKAMEEKLFSEFSQCFFNTDSEVFDSERVLPEIIAFITKNPNYLSFLFSLEPDATFDRIFLELSKRGVHCFDYLIKSGPMEEIDFYVHSLFVTSSVISTVFGFIKKHTEASETSVKEFAIKVSQLIHNGISENDEILSPLILSKLDEKCLSSVENLPPVNEKLAALSRVIAKKGLADFTVEAFADELGLAKSSLYSFFENRDDMIRSLVGKEFFLLCEKIRDNISNNSSMLEKSYIIIQTEFFFFCKRRESLDACRWISFVSDFGGCENCNSEEMKKNFGMINEFQKCFTQGMENFCIENFGTNVFLLWLFLLPSTILIQAEKHNFSHELLTSAMKECFFLVERGLKQKKVTQYIK